MEPETPRWHCCGHLARGIKSIFSMKTAKSPEKEIWVHGSYRVTIEDFYEDYIDINKIFSKNRNMRLEIDCGDAEELPSKELSDCIRRMHHLERISFRGKRVKIINDFLLYNCFNIKHLDLNNLPAVEEIGSFFLYNCCSLEAFSLNWSRIKKTGECFFFGCIALQELCLMSLHYPQEWNNNDPNTSDPISFEGWFLSCPALEVITIWSHQKLLAERLPVRKGIIRLQHLDY